MSKTKKTFKIGRNAGTGHFMPVAKAKKDPKHTTVEIIKKKS